MNSTKTEIRSDYLALIGASGSPDVGAHDMPEMLRALEGAADTSREKKTTADAEYSAELLSQAKTLHARLAGSIGQTTPFPKLSNDPAKDSPKLKAFIEDLRADLIAFGHVPATATIPVMKPVPVPKAQAAAPPNALTALLALSQINPSEAILVQALDNICDPQERSKFIRANEGALLAVARKLETSKTVSIAPALAAAIAVESDPILAEYQRVSALKNPSEMNKFISANGPQIQAALRRIR